MLAALWAAVAVCAALLAVSALPDAASALALAAFCAVVAVCAALLAVPALPDAASALALATLAASALERRAGEQRYDHRRGVPGAGVSPYAVGPGDH